MRTAKNPGRRCPETQSFRIRQPRALFRCRRRRSSVVNIIACLDAILASCRPSSFFHDHAPSYIVFFIIRLLFAPRDMKHLLQLMKRRSTAKTFLMAVFFFFCIFVADSQNLRLSPIASATNCPLAGKRPTINTSGLTTSIMSIVSLNFLFSLLFNHLTAISRILEAGKGVKAGNRLSLQKRRSSRILGRNGVPYRRPCSGNICKPHRTSSR